VIAPAGRKLGKYEILRKLGRGGMADVYLAQDTEANGQVVHDRTEASSAIDQLQHFQRVVVRQEEPLRPQHDPGVAGLIEARRHGVWEPF